MEDKAGILWPQSVLWIITVLLMHSPQHDASDVASTAADGARHGFTFLDRPRVRLAQSTRGLNGACIYADVGTSAVRDEADGGNWKLPVMCRTRDTSGTANMTLVSPLGKTVSGQRTSGNSFTFLLGSQATSGSYMCLWSNFSRSTCPRRNDRIDVNRELVQWAVGQARLDDFEQQLASLLEENRRLRAQVSAKKRECENREKDGEKQAKPKKRKPPRWMLEEPGFGGWSSDRSRPWGMMPGPEPFFGPRPAEGPGWHKLA